MLDQTKLEALLGRSLTAREVTNLKLYLEIARESLEGLLCTNLCGGVSVQSFTPREGYKTIWTGIFTDVISVKVDGEDVEYYPAQFDKRNASWYNSIVLKDFTDGEVKVEAEWGFDPMPSDLQQLLAQLFVDVSKQYEAGSVKSKKVEDFSITYGDLTDDEEFLLKNQRTIQRYSLCSVGSIVHGDVCDDFRRIY